MTVLWIAYGMIVVAVPFIVFNVYAITLDIKHIKEERHAPNGADGSYVPPALRGYTKGARDADTTYEQMLDAQRKIAQDDKPQAK